MHIFIGLLTGASVLSLMQVLVCCLRIFLPQKNYTYRNKALQQQANTEKAKKDDIFPEDIPMEIIIK